MGAYDYGREYGSPSMYYDFFVDAGSESGDAAPGLSGWLGAFADDAEYGPGAGGTMYTSQPIMFSVQTSLKNRGYNPGPVDGKFGPQTEAAIMSFNLSRGIHRDGPPDLDTLHALGVDTDGSMWRGSGYVMSPVDMIGASIGLPMPGGSPAPNIPGAQPSIITGPVGSATAGPTKKPPAPTPAPIRYPPNGPADHASSGKGVIESITSFFGTASPVTLGVAAAGVLYVAAELLSGPAPRSRRRAVRRRRR